MSLVEDVTATTGRVVSESDPRFQIAAARRILYREGLDSQVGGHVSVRVPGEEAFLVTPYQYFDETLPEHVSKVATSGRWSGPSVSPQSGTGCAPSASPVVSPGSRVRCTPSYKASSSRRCSTSISWCPSW